MSQHKGEEQVVIHHNNTFGYFAGILLMPKTCILGGMCALRAIPANCQRGVAAWHTAGPADVVRPF